MSIHVHEGDITQAQVDAIVNAANTAMLGGGGVDGAIHRVAGSALLEACRQIDVVDGVRCPTGQARITPAGNLAADFVIHTVGPVYHQVADPAALLRSAYINSLTLARQYDCQSIAFPAISCGVYGYPPEEAVKIVKEVCLLRSFSSMEKHFYLFGHELFLLWTRHLLGED